MKTPQKYNPIYLTPEEADKPFDELVDSIRSDLTRLRGKIREMECLYPGWARRIEYVGGALTCIIVALYNGMMEYREVQAKRAKIEEVGK
jgi:hypothetical protein